ncbi:MAG: hypothetical protein OHK0029_12370 [Armatimonadaceae bacterium]
MGTSLAAHSELTLCIFVDAFGWELAQRHPDFLADVLPVRAPLQTIFGYSCTCDPTILTGKLPRDHGHFSFFRYAPQDSPFRRAEISWLGKLPASITGRGRVRHHISKWLGKRLGYTGYFQIYNMPFAYLPLFDYTEKRDLYQPQGINNGCPTIFDLLREGQTPFFCSDWRCGEDINFATLSDALQSQRPAPRFAYLYLAEMDGILHAEGTGSERVSRKIVEYDRRIRALLQEAAKHYERVRVFLFSDHGMTDVTRLCPLQDRIAHTGLRFGQDYAAVYDSTMARFWFLKPEARERIGNALCEEPDGAIVPDSTLREWGCDFPDRRYGELFFSLKPGVLLCPSFLGEKPLRGMHGYAPEHPDSTAFFATNAPEYSSRPPHRLDDLFALMRDESGVSVVSPVSAPLAQPVGERDAR